MEQKLGDYGGKKRNCDCSIQFFYYWTAGLTGRPSVLRINETHINIIKLITKCAKVFHFHFPVLCHSDPRGGQSSSSSPGVFDKKCKLKAIYFHLA